MYTRKVYSEVFGLCIPNTSNTNGQNIENNKMCLWLNFFPDFFYRVWFKLIHLSLESDSVNYQCNKYCVTRKHCDGGDCGWLWGSGHCHFYGCRKNRVLRYMYMIRGSRKIFRGWEGGGGSVPDNPFPFSFRTEHVYYVWCS